MDKPRWVCAKCAESNSYWAAKCKECGITVVQHKKILKTNKAPASEVPCSAGVMVPLLLADELLEECWNATSKLESQFLRNEDIPRAYAEIIDKSFAALKKLQAARMAA